MIQVLPLNYKLKCSESTDIREIEDKYIQRSGGSGLYEATGRPNLVGMQPAAL